MSFKSPKIEKVKIPTVAQPTSTSTPVAPNDLGGFKSMIATATPDNPGGGLRRRGMTRKPTLLGGA